MTSASCRNSLIPDYDLFGGGQIGIASYAVGPVAIHGKSARVTMHLRLSKAAGTTTATLVMTRAAALPQPDERGARLSRENPY